MASGAGHHRGSLRAERQLPPMRGNGGGGGGGNLPIRPKSASATRRSVTAGHHVRASFDDDNDSGRVRVAVRLRPKSPEDYQFDSDFTDCVELQTELKRVKLRRNNWSSESYKFDEVFSESASQKRVYDAVAKPVVESVLEGYNGTVMAYGQTGTGKTYTVGRLGKDDPSERGIMVRALEDIFASTISGSDIVSISYLQLYLESIQDLLSPEKINIPIIEDQKTGEVSLPGSAIVEIRDLDHFLKLLQIGETNRYAANTKLSTESSRSHAILMVHIQRSLKVKEENDISSLANITNSNISSHHVPHVLRSKLLIVDLAGSERIDKSGSEGHMLEETKFINLSLTSLGKCINALAENSPHIPTRDSKLTRLLRDSFGGTARTSLIVTIGPSTRHYSETASTIMFGQRAMKIVNAVKLREEVDYESLCKKLENHVDYLTSETDRQQKLREIEKEQTEKKMKQYEASLTETKTRFSLEMEHLEKEKNQLELENKSSLKQLEIQKCENAKLSQQIVQLEASLEQSKQRELENSAHQNVVADKTELYEKKIAELFKQLENEHSRYANLEEQLIAMQQYMADNTSSAQTQDKVIDELKREILKLNEDAARNSQLLELRNMELMSEKEGLLGELASVQGNLLHEETQRKCLEGEIAKLKQILNDEVLERESKRPNNADGLFRPHSPLGGSSTNISKSKPRETITGQRDTITKIFEEVGLSNILALLKSEDVAVQIHAVKVVANLAAEDINQERIVKEGGLDALLMLLESADDTTVRRVTSGAVANLAMNGVNQELIMNQGGTKLLSNLVSKTDDPQTLRMVAGALANLCGNEKLHDRLKTDGGIEALLGMARSGHGEVIAQVARGFANLAKCESRGISQGCRKGRSLLIEDGALNWMVNNSATFSASTRRHIELALCHLAQNEDNTSDIIASGGIKELVRISHESTRDDIRNLAKKSLNSNPAFSAEIKKS